MKRIISLVLLTSFVLCILSGFTVLGADEKTFNEYTFDNVNSLPSYVIGGIDGTPGTNILYDSGISYTSGGGSVYFRGWRDKSRVDFGGLFDGLNPGLGDVFKLSAWVKLNPEDRVEELEPVSPADLFLTVASSQLVSGKKYYTLIYNESAQDSPDSIKTVTTDEWTKLEMEYTVGDVLPAYIGICRKGVPVETAVAVNIDNVKVEPVKRAEKPSVYSFDGLDNLPEYVVEGKHAAFSDGAVQLDNSVDCNDSAESGSIYLRGWSNSSRVDFAGLFSDIDLAADFGKSYKVSAKVKQTNDMKGNGKTAIPASDDRCTARIMLSSYDLESGKTYNKIIYNNTDDAVRINGDTWTEISIIYTVGRTTSEIPKSVCIKGTDATVSNTELFALYIDDVSVEPYDTPITYYKKFVEDFDGELKGTLSTKNTTNYSLNEDISFGGLPGKSLQASYWDAHRRVYYSGAFENLEIKPGSRFRISYMAKLGEGKPNILMAASVHSFDYTLLGIGPYTTITADKWTKVTFDYEFTGTAAPNYITFANKDASNVSDEIYFDNLTVVDITDIAEPYLTVTPSFSESSLSGKDEIDVSVTTENKVDDDTYFKVVYAVYDGYELKNCIFKDAVANYNNQNNLDTLKISGLSGYSEPVVKVLVLKDIYSLEPIREAAVLDE